MVKEQSLVGQLRRPKYTGENRCLACTVVNVVLVAVGSAAVATTLSPAAGAGLLVIGMAAIYFWGYAVPGTPTFTQYLPNQVLALFDHHQPTVSHDDSEEMPDPESELYRAEAIKECRDGTDLCLTDSFRSEWYVEMEAIDGAAIEGRIRDAIPGDVEITEGDGELYVRRDGEMLAHWVSRTAAVADFASERILADRHPEWDSYTAVQRSAIARGLRPFINGCPACNGHVATEKVTSCCRTGRAIIVIHCTGCDTVLFESEPFTDLPK